MHQERQQNTPRKGGQAVTTYGRRVTLELRQDGKYPAISVVTVIASKENETRGLELKV
jgi:hypothetical protein